MANASSVSPEALPYDVVDLTPLTVVAFRSGVAPKGSREPTLPVESIGRRVVGLDDVLSVHIVERYAGGIFSTLKSAETLVVTRRVGPDGTIEVPFAGTVMAAGRDISQIQSDIQARLVGKANDPQVIVGLESDRTNVVVEIGRAHV